MTQNRSSAVMQQRRDKAKASLDDFPTPPWATRALLQHALSAHALIDLTACDPCCNRGHMVRPLVEQFGRVVATDVADYTGDPRAAMLDQGRSVWLHRFEQDGLGDFLLPVWQEIFPRGAAAEWFFMNPPYKLAEAFIVKALDLVAANPKGEGVAVFVRGAFVEGQERYERLFRDRPPSFIAWFAERVTLLEGVLRDPDKEFFNPLAHNGKGGWQKPASATQYCWMVWLKDTPRRPDVWIPPCRQALTRAGDYPRNADERGVFTPPPPAGQGAML